MAEKVKCESCDRIFKNNESLAMHNAAKHPETIPKEKNSFPVKKIKNWTIAIIIFGVVIFGIVWLISNSENSGENSGGLPPIDMSGHIEANPKSHVLKKPMDIRIQKHMLEHVDGIESGRGGVIINYDCENFECEGGLVENLESFAGKYDYVYVAPFKNMPVKIILTKLGRIEKLAEYDESRIELFIEQ